MKRLVLLIFLMFYANTVWADQPIDLVKVLCIQKKGMPYFSVEVDSFAEAADYIYFGKSEGNETTKEQRIAALRGYGLIYPKDFKYECVLENVTYRITGNEPPHAERGMCGGDPRLVISLYMNEKLLLKDVYMAPSCFTELSGETNPYINKIVVDEGVKGWGETSILASVTGKTEKKLLSLLNQFTEDSSKYIDQNYIDCIVQSGFFDATKETTALEKCHE